MAGYIDQVLPEQTQPATYQEIRTEHQANGVPVSSWRSLVNVGLSLTQYVSEAITTARNIVRTVLRGLCRRLAATVRRLRPQVGFRALV